MTLVTILNPGKDPADNGRTISALKLAQGLAERGAPVMLFFCGEGVRWIDRFVSRTDDSHPFVRNYGPVFDGLRAHVHACNMCCRRFDQLEAVQGAGIPVHAEGREHADLAPYVLDGAQVINF